MGVNKDLGLPFGEGMEKVAVCFDVDGTLISSDANIECTNEWTLSLLISFINQKWKNVDVIVWSGSGKKYAETMINRYAPALLPDVKFYSKLEYEQIRKKYDKIIAFDDVQDTRLGDVNMIVRNK